MDNNLLHCTYRKLPGGIYEIEIHHARRESVREFFEILQEVYAEVIAEGRLPVRTIVIAPRGGPMPVIHVAAELRHWMPLHGKTPSRTVILYEGSFVPMVDIMTRNFGSRTALMRVLAPNRREEGMQWLMSDLHLPVELI